MHMKAVLHDVADIKQASAGASLHALACPAYVRAHTIFCYAAMPHEADPVLFVEAARAAGKCIAFPVCSEAGAMQAYAPLDEGAWETGAFGIPAPIPARSRLIAPDEIDFILVPGLAFTSAGGRLGRGAGYYDRYFENTRAYRLGFCMDIQIVDYIPMKEHDFFMNGVVTEGRCYYGI